MTDTTLTQLFTLRRIDEHTWAIRDAHLTTDAAHLTVTEDDVVEVVWNTPLPLPLTYATVEDVLDSLRIWAHRESGSTKPIPIPHFPPPAH